MTRTASAARGRPFHGGEGPGRTPDRDRHSSIQFYERGRAVQMLTDATAGSKQPSSRRRAPLGGRGTRRERPAGGGLGRGTVTGLLRALPSAPIDARPAAAHSARHARNVAHKPVYINDGGGKGGGGKGRRMAWERCRSRYQKEPTGGPRRTDRKERAKRKER